MSKKLIPSQINLAHLEYAEVYSENELSREDTYDMTLSAFGIESTYLWTRYSLKTLEE